MGFLRACVKKAQRGECVETGVWDPQGKEVMEESGKMVVKHLN